MTDCERLSERMPAVALGRDRWTAEEERHLAGCDECRAEWSLIRLTGRIGAGAPRPGSDPALAAAVLRRLAQAPPRAAGRRPGRWALGLAAAAGLALAVWTGVAREGSPGSQATVATSDTFASAALDSLLDGEEPLAGWSMLESPGLGDLDEGELERVLSTWEG